MADLRVIGKVLLHSRGCCLIHEGAAPLSKGPDNPRKCVAVALVVAALLLKAGEASGQSAAIAIGIEASRDRVEYHFDNPSSFDTSNLVPHFFEQRYVADNIWATLTASYTAGVRWRTLVAVTPNRTSRADDFDTFFDPDGTVWVSGTTGDAVMRAFRVEQRADLGSAGSLRLQTGYSLRWDRAKFLVGHKTVTKNGLPIETFAIDTRERTRVWTYQFFAGGSFVKALGSAWTLTAGGDVSPATVARLEIQLPDKYPGRDLTFSAAAFGASGSVEIARGRFAIGVDADRIWRYRSTSAVSRRSVAVRIAVRI